MEPVAPLDDGASGGVHVARATGAVEQDHADRYDTAGDPYEIENLAGRPEHRARLERMRAANEAWLARTGDLGTIPEAELAERFWPGGVQPVTPPPHIDPPGATSDRPIEVTLFSDVAGASLEYTPEEGAGARWKLYSHPIAVDLPATLRARAVRYGWAESAEAGARFEIAPAR